MKTPKTNYDTTKGGAAEPGAWRVEVSPSDPANDDRFLHVLTVMDATNQTGPEATLLQSDTHQGAAILDRAVLFGRDPGPLDHADFDLPGVVIRKVLVCDLAPGHWVVQQDGQIAGDGEVTQEGTCLYFKVGPGSYHLEQGTVEPHGDGGVGDGGNLSGDGGLDAGPQGGNPESGCSCRTRRGRAPMGQPGSSGLLWLLFAGVFLLSRRRSH